jgi:hypothetical protein
MTQNHRKTPTCSIESLESRRLLAGVTLLIHGNEGSIGGWVQSAASAIAKRIGTSQASRYVMTVENVGGDAKVTSLTLKNGPKLDASTQAEAIISVDWTAIDSGNFSTVEVGQAVADYLTTAHGSMRPLAELPIHLIGHSRGASMVVAISRRLGNKGILVDQDTFLDPHPIDGDANDFFADFGDISMRVYENVIFADNYWRTDGEDLNFDPDGEEVDSAHEGDLNDIVQNNFTGSAHAAVTAYYHGTIDTSSSGNGDHPVRSSWYSNTTEKPAKNQTGYRFSRIVGGARPTDGLSPQFGGTANRATLEPAGVQWASVAKVQALNGNTYPIGPTFLMRLLYQDSDSNLKVTVFLDRDNSPYNGNNALTMRRFNLPQASDVTAKRFSTVTAGASPGDYFIGVAVTDEQGNLRFSYSPKITLTASSSSIVATDSPNPATKSQPKTTGAHRVAESVLA